MKLKPLAKLLFWVLLAVVLYFALVPDPFGIALRSDTASHFLAFLVLPAVAAFAWPETPEARLWLAFAVFGGMIEILQTGMGLGRHGEWRDWFNDLAAITIALSVAAISRRLFRTEVQA